MEISLEQLQSIMPAAGERASIFLDFLNRAMDRFEINTAARQTAFLAQVAHESTQLNRTAENLNYSAQALLSEWPRRFNAAEVNQYARKPEAIANRAYALRLGNADEASGDGWKYRGRGLLQITGRANYRACAAGIGLPLEAQPELLEEPEGAALSAAWFWDLKNLNGYADKGSFEAITLLINGGKEGLTSRMAFYQKAIAVLNA